MSCWLLCLSYHIWRFWSHLLLWVCAIPPFDLCQLKSLTVISCSLAYWGSAWYVTSSCHFFDLTHFYTSKVLGGMKKKFSSTYQFLTCWVLASFDKVLDSLIKLVIWLIVSLFYVAVISHPCDSSMTLRLQGYQLWPWKLSLDLFGLPHLLRWVKYSIF